MKKIPVGIENFKEIIDDQYYYIDKTELINDVMNEKLVFLYKTKKIWKNIKHEYALLFLFSQGER